MGYYGNYRGSGYDVKPWMGPTADTPASQHQAQNDAMAREAARQARGQRGGSTTLSPGMFDSARDQYLAKGVQSYNPYMAQQGGEFETMNFDPYRSAATNQAAGGAAQEMVSAQAQLSGTGGMSTADRIKLINDFNRRKILGQLGAHAEYDKRGSGNAFEVGRQNVGRLGQVDAANIGAQNEASRQRFGSQLAQTQNLYKTAMDERDLQRRLAASKLIGEDQLSAIKPSWWDNIVRGAEEIFSGARL